MMRTIIRKARKALVDRMSHDVYARHFERKHLKKLGATVRYSDAYGFQISEGDSKIVTPRRTRLHYYLKGLNARLDFIKWEYLGDHHIEFQDGDIVIDCGANIGEFALSLNLKDTHRLFAFEPDPTEFKALERNISSSHTALNFALWESDSEIEFFMANDTGDSSALPQPNAQTSAKVPARRLDTFLNEAAPLGDIRLIKLEAEGAEPNVLTGSEGVLNRTHFIAVDAGPEHGLEQSSTLPSVCDILHEGGFQMINFNPRRVTCLFENRNYR